MKIWPARTGCGLRLQRTRLLRRRLLSPPQLPARPPPWRSRRLEASGPEDVFSPLAVLKRQALSGSAATYSSCDKRQVSRQTQRNSRVLRGEMGHRAEAQGLTPESCPVPRAGLGKNIQSLLLMRPPGVAPPTGNPKWKGGPALHPMGLKGVQTALSVLRLC